MYRSERIGELLQSFLSSAVRLLNDPRLEFVSITEVRVSKDYKSAKVFWSVPGTYNEEKGAFEQFPDSGKKKEVGDALDGVKSFLKRRIAEELDLRYVPDLKFVYDESAQTGSRIDELLKKAGY